MFERRQLWFAALGVVGVCMAAGPAHGRRAGGDAASATFTVAVPPQAFDLILARPEADRVTLSVLAYEELEGQVAYGTQPGACTQETPVRAFRRGEPAAVVLAPLQADTRYYYRFRHRTPCGRFTEGPEYSFHTARPPRRTSTSTSATRS